jgi:radical SAM protein with 4Fe4S-binding SPASM domain
MISFDSIHIINNYLLPKRIKDSQRLIVRIYRKILKIIIPNKFLLLAELKPPLPETAVIDPSSVCMLHCPLCPTGTGTIRLNKAIMNLDDFTLYLEKIPSIKHISLFNWGEPFLNRQIFDIIQYAHFKKKHLLIDSNFSLKFSDEDLLKIINSGLDVLRISLDGASQKTYGMYRKNGNFHLVYRNLKRLRILQKQMNAHSPRIIWKFVVNKFNEHELTKAKRKAKEIDVEFLINTIGLADDIPDASVPPGVTLKAKMSYWLPKNKKLIFYKYKDKNNASVSSKEQRCDWIFDSIVVHPDGSVLPCCFITDKKNIFGNLKAQTIEEIWYSDQYMSARNKFLHNQKVKHVPVICDHCPYYP